jgi:hypothetical protein
MYTFLLPLPSFSFSSCSHFHDEYCVLLAVAVVAVVVAPRTAHRP